MLCRRSGDPLSSDVRVSGRSQRVRLVRGTRQAARDGAVLDPRRQRHDRVARRGRQRVLDACHGQSVAAFILGWAK